MILIKPKRVVVNSNLDCSEIEKCMGAIKLSQSPERLGRLQNALNYTFRGTHCNGVIYTKNTDKLFFGMCVMPVISDEEVTKLLIDNNASGIPCNYMLEFDSKLFNIGLNTRELTAILLHEIGHIVINMEQALEELVDAICMYLAKNRDCINVKSTYKCKRILAFGIKNALRSIGDIFVDDEVNADSFAVALGYGKDLERALDKIASSVTVVNKDVKNKLLVLQWTLRLYKNLRLRRIPAIKTLQKAYELEGSELQKREINKCMRAISDMSSTDIESVEEQAVLLHEKLNLNIFRKFRQKSIRGIEDDLYEYTLRVKSVDEQDEALIILRDINSRLAIIDDYLSDPNLSKAEIERWQSVRKRYMMLREELSKKTTYDDKYYGLFVKTPVIKSRYEF